MTKIYLTALLLILTSCIPPLGKDFYCDQSFLKTRVHLKPSSHNIVGRSPKDLLYALSVGETDKTKVVTFYSAPNQKYKGDLVMGFVDKNTKKAYMNLGNSAAASGNAVIRIDTYLKYYSSTNKEYAKSISHSAVKSWHTASSINGNSKPSQKCMQTQKAWNKHYNHKNNSILKNGTREVRRIKYSNRLFVTRNDLGGF